MLFLSYNNIVNKHPIAKAVVNYAEELKTKLKKIENFVSHTGQGIEFDFENKHILIGKADFVKAKEVSVFSAQGKTSLYVYIDNEFTGIIAVSDTVRENAAETIAELKRLGIKTIMLTGDNALTADYIGGIVGVDEIIAEGFTR